MEQTKYDVFISYSRKDYVRDDQLIPGNPITAIQEMFDQNGISYWFDKDGIYSGEEFVKEISHAIVASKMLVFISSENSNVSEYTCGEILKAKKAKKLIIPFLINQCDYNPKFEILLLPLNHIDYVAQPNTALPELLRTVKKEKEKIEKIEADSDRSKQIESVKKEIKEKAKEYLALAGPQDYILKDLYSKNKFIGNTIKRCPVCEKEEPIQSQFCSQCGWQFPKLYGIDGGNVPLHDEAQLAIARKCWQGFGNIVTLQKENESLMADKRQLNYKLDELESKLESFRVKNAEIEKRYKELERKQNDIEEKRIQEEAKRKAEEAKREEEMRRGNFTVNGVSFKMIRVEGGTFMMGATPEQGIDAFDDERPVHQVTLSDYYIGETQVTQELWQAVMHKNPSRFMNDNSPVDSVSWNNCQQFVLRLNQLTGKNFRLPTEAEWEFAARGGVMSQNYIYSGGNCLDDVGWYLDNSFNKTHQVKQKKPNELGLYDMSGNIWEWCQDFYEEYDVGVQRDPMGLLQGSHHVYRGGCWCEVEDCRVTSRRAGAPDFASYGGLGLRLALTF